MVIPIQTIPSVLTRDFVYDLLTPPLPLIVAAGAADGEITRKPRLQGDDDTRVGLAFHRRVRTVIEEEGFEFVDETDLFVSQRCPIMINPDPNPSRKMRRINSMRDQMDSDRLDFASTRQKSRVESSFA